jgi:predicted house-cleaning noncanonical NTP pyrophosphatase (MazG superfamily)
MKTRTFKLNKLVRDKIVQSTQAQGGEVGYKTLSGKELVDALVAKFIEEAQELRTSQLSADELADLKEIIEQIAKNLKITDKELANAQAEKRAKNGGFTKGHFIDTVTLPADNKWAKYYAADPDRFLEIKK